MSNQSVMTFDEDFLLDRLVECLSICENQQKNGFDNPELFQKALDKGLSWINNHAPKCELGLPSSEICKLEGRLFSISIAFLVHGIDEVLHSNEKNQPVPKPAPSAQLSVFRVLGKASKFQSLYALNEQRPSPASVPEWAYWPLFSIGWRPSLTVTKRILSHTRPVGGLA